MAGAQLGELMAENWHEQLATLQACLFSQKLVHPVPKSRSCLQINFNLKQSHVGANDPLASEVWPWAIAVTSVINLTAGALEVCLYHFYPPAIDTLVTGMVTAGISYAKEHRNSTVAAKEGRPPVLRC